MKNILQRLGAMAVMAVITISAFSQQMPAAISIEPSNATGWDEITLTLDPSKACVPDGKGSVEGASVVKMHSAAFLYDDIDNWGSAWGGVGVDYDAEPKDGVHDAPDLTPNGDGTYSITFVPADFYGVEEGATIIGISAVFNSGTWDNEAKDVGDDGCGDFYIPLSYTDPSPALKFKLDLTYQEELGNFSTDGEAFVVVNDTEYKMDQLLEGIFPVSKFEYTLKDGITEGESYTYYFKMNDTEESIDPRTVEAEGFQKTLDHYFNDEKPVATGNVTFTVDMRYQIREGKFDPDSDTLDVAGSMNGWDGKDHLLTDADLDSVYEVTVEQVELGVIEYKYRINGNWDNSEFPGGGPNRKYTVTEGDIMTKDIYSNYRPGWVPFTFNVDMTVKIDSNQFDPASDYLDVQGTMNGWDGRNHLFDDDGDHVYTTSYIAPKMDTIEFKFRINGSWDNDKHEFSGGQPGRKIYVEDTAGGVTNVMEPVYFNDVAPPPGVVTFMVDMKYMIEDGKFNPDSHYVDVAGSFNEWDGKNHHMTNEDNDSVYAVTVSMAPKQVIEFKYRIDGSWDDDKSEFPAGGANRTFYVKSDTTTFHGIFNDYRPNYVPVVFNVNMGPYTTAGKFDPEMDFLDLGGSFNEWGANPVYLTDTDNDSIYSAKVPMEIGADIEYKTRINGDWNTSEFPDGGDNRTYTVLDTAGGETNVIDIFYNDEEVVSIRNIVIRSNNVEVYPNPVRDILVVKNTTEIDRVVITNLSGQQMQHLNMAPTHKVNLNTAGLSNGFYIVTVYSNRQIVGVKKIMKQ